ENLTFLPLPSTRAEADAVAALFARVGQADPTVISGRQATKDAVRAALPGHRYVHLATHGYFAPPKLKAAGAFDADALTLETAGRLGSAALPGFYPGLLSGLVWAGANTPPKDPATGIVAVGEGVMTAEEVSGLDLSACDLAVLSACETGLGKVAGGEGVLG